MKFIGLKAAFVTILILLNAAASQLSQAAVTLEPLASFGGGDGWLAPDEAVFLQGANVQRGLAYNSANNQVVVVDRNAGTFVRILDGNTGSLLNSLDVTGVAGGTFAANMVGVAGDGAIYVGNLSTAATANFNVYRWADSLPTTVPTIAYTGTPGLARIGDTFAVIGSGADTRIVASGSGHNGLVVLDTADGSSFTLTSANTIAGAPNGAFRLGLDFVNATTVVGKQTGTAAYRVDLTTSTLETGTVTTASESLVAYYEPMNLMATVEFSTSQVRVYDATTFATLALIDGPTTNIPGTSVTNANGVGDLQFGLGPNGDLRLYVLNTNNGIQAFSVVAIPEPGSFGVLALIACSFAKRLRRR